MCILAMLTVGFKLLSHLVLKNLNCECPGRTRLSTNFHVHYYLPRRSMQSFSLSDCAFHLALEVGCLSSLKCVCLSYVHITGEELCGFLSKSLALEQLDHFECSDIVCLKIPSVLLQLNFLQVQECVMLELIESDAPNLSMFCYTGRRTPNPSLTWISVETEAHTDEFW